MYTYTSAGPDRRSGTRRTRSSCLESAPSLGGCGASSGRPNERATKGRARTSHQLTHVGAAVATEDLHDLGHLGAPLQGVIGKELEGVRNVLVLLRPRL